MFWANTSPSPEATTDFGVMSPRMVATRCRRRFGEGLRGGGVGAGDVEGDVWAAGGAGSLGDATGPGPVPAAVVPVSRAPKNPDRHSRSPTASSTRRARTPPKP